MDGFTVRLGFRKLPADVDAVIVVVVVVKKSRDGGVDNLVVAGVDLADAATAPGATRAAGATTGATRYFVVVVVG